MRLGVVLTGTGVYGAAGTGVLLELWRRQMEPYAVCGLGSGAWTAALFAAGCSGAQMEAACAQAQHMGKRLLRRAGHGLNAKAIYRARGLEQLLQIQTGGRLLALCPRRALFPVRSLRSGTLAFASRCNALGDGVIHIAQASAAFAARAAMGLPPFLEPLDWMGAPMLPIRDTALAARLLFASGAQRVLIVDIKPSPRVKMDRLLLAAACMETGQERMIPSAVRLNVQMPESIGAFSFKEMTACMEWGRHAASRDMDGLFDMLGMASCRVLPFKRV